VRKNLFILFLFQVGLLSGQAHFWPFGQGLGLDFNQNPPQLRSVPWQRSSTPQFQNDLNQCSVFEDDSGQVVLYFLNGQYMDANDNVVYSVPNYYRAPSKGSGGAGNMFSSHESNFFRFNDTLFHSYTSGGREGPIVNPIFGITNNLKIYLNRIQESNGIVSVQVVDSFPRIENSNDDRNTFRLFDLDADSLKFVIYSSYEEARVQIPGVYEAAEKKMLTLSSQGFSVQEFNSTTDKVRALTTRSVYSSLTKSVYSFSNDKDNIHLLRYKTSVFNAGSTPTFVEVDSMVLYSPKDGVGVVVSRGRVLRLDESQRYLFIALRIQDFTLSGITRIIRYDLLARNQNEFQSSAVDLKAPSSLNVNDMQFGPDGDLYVLWSDQIRRTAALQSCDRIGRIINPTSLDTSQISCQENFLTTQPWQAYAMFPDFTSRQKNFTYFEILYACQDSVQFRLDYGRGVDSVIWNFGEPTLGAANTSQDLDPVVAYPQAGTYFVRVELWWKGEKLHTLSDSVEVLPVIDFSLPEDTILCEGEELLLDVSQDFSVQYSWNTGDTAGQITVDSAGWYQVELTNACGQMSDSIWVDYIPDPQASLRDTSLCEQDSNLLVSLPYNENYFYRWSTGADSSAIAINDSGTYFVTYGSYCDSISESFSIEKRPCSCELFIPNAFTPNGDGLNDEFIIVSPCEELEFELLIFNRWGILVHQQSSGTPSWDGYYNGELTPGVYVYKINYRGRSMAGPVEGKESGSLTLLR
jgi:gliding motility-associated-like protein